MQTEFPNSNLACWRYEGILNDVKKVKKLMDMDWSVRYWTILHFYKLKETSAHFLAFYGDNKIKEQKPKARHSKHTHICLSLKKVNTYTYTRICILLYLTAAQCIFLFILHVAILYLMVWKTSSWQKKEIHISTT